MDTQTDIRDAADTLSPNWDGERLFPAEQGNIMKAPSCLDALSRRGLRECETTRRRTGLPGAIENW